MLITSLDNSIKNRYERNRKALSASRKKDIFSKYMDIQSKAYKKTLLGLSSYIPDFKASKRIFVLTPAFYEGENIITTLNKLIPPSNTKLSKFWQQRVEFIILNNYWQNRPEIITNEFLRSKIRNKNFKDIFVINYPLKTKRSRVGFLRKILHDIVIYKAKKTGGEIDRYIFSSFDGDILEADLRIFRKAYRLLNANDQLDAVQGDMTRIASSLPRHSLFYIFSVLYDELRKEWQSKRYRSEGTPKLNFMWNRVFTYGANLFLKSKTYCEIGGFDDLPLGEDYAISAKISFLRASCSDVMKCANTNTIAKLGYKIVNHPRRDIYAFYKKMPVYKNFGNYNSEIKIREFGSHWLGAIFKLDEVMPFNRKNIESILEVLSQKNRKRIIESGAGGAIFKNAVIRTLRKNKKELPKKIRRMIYDYTDKILANEYKI